MNPTKKYITAAVILAVCGFLLSAIYIIYLLTKPPVMELPSGPEIDYDVYQDKLDQGVGAGDYEERELYTDEHYEVDKEIFINYFENELYDMASEHATVLLASYKFNDDKLSTISAIEKMNIFEKDKDDNWLCTTEERINIYTQIHDIDIYMYFFINIPISEQAMLIYRNDVNMLPGFKWESITWEVKTGMRDDVGYQAIGTREYYNVKLTYKNNCYYAKVIIHPSLEIVCITNEDGTMDGIKYQPAKPPYEEDIFH